MKTERVYSKNATFQRFEVLKTNRSKRYAMGEFWIEGVRNINEARKNGWEISSLLFSREKPLSRWAEDTISSTCTRVNYELPLSLMRELSGKEDTSELLAIGRMREDSFSQLRLAPSPLIALFDRPSNRGNLGTLLRSCDALGVNGLILTGHAVDLYDPEVIVASMGSFFSVPAIRVAENRQVFEFVEEMRRRYPLFQTVGTTAHAQVPIYELDLTRPTLLLIGNETDGLCRAFKDSCDRLATIPMSADSAATSFNVSCAATVLFYEAVRQRSGAVGCEAKMNAPK